MLAGWPVKSYYVHLTCMACILRGVQKILRGVSEIVTLDWPCTPRKTNGAEWVWVTSHHVAIYATPTAFLLCKGMHRILGRGWPDAVAVKEPHHLRSRQSEVRLCYGRTRTDLVGEQ